MDWLILILGVPAILIPLVLLFGFAGCGQVAGVCASDVDCPAGTRCVDGACVALQPNPPPLAPENLAARALDDRSVSLTWTNTDPAVTDFEIERTPEDGEVDEVELIPAPDSPTGATDSFGLQAGVTYIYRVRALLGEERSEFSDTSSATVFPAAPVALVATAVSIDQIDLSWTNASAIETEYSVEHRVPGGVFAEIIPGPGAATTFSHRGLDEGTTHEYRVLAVVDGVEDDVAQEVTSAPSAIAPATTLAFTVAFQAPQGTLINELPNVGFCLVQRLSTTLLAATGTTPTQVRILLRGPNTGSLTLDRVTISQTADSQPGATGTEDLYDAAPDLTEIASGVTIAANTTRTVGPVNYALDFTQDLLVAFDISNTPGEANVRFGALTGAHAFSNPGTAEAGVQDRTTGYPNDAPDTLALVEIVEVL
jgi:Fibronectin type III domain